jgi:hypothetical protein
MSHSRILSATALVGAALLLAGCSQITDLFGGPQAVRDAQSGEVTDAGQMDVFTLSVGDCLNDTGSTDEVFDVPVVPCSDPHDYEVYYDYTLPSGEYPGEEAVFAAAEADCPAQFESFVGLPYDESTLIFSYYVPTAESWAGQGDRVVSCLIGDGAGQVTGTLAGSGR